MKKILIRTLIVVLEILAWIFEIIFLPILSFITIIFLPIVIIIYIFKGKNLLTSFKFKLFNKCYDFSDFLFLPLELNMTLVNILEETYLVDNISDKK